MELDQLKETWGNMGSTSSASEQELQAMLQKKSKSPIAKMSRNLLVEMLVVAVLYTYSIFQYFMKFNGQFCHSEERGIFAISSVKSIANLCRVSNEDSSFLGMTNNM